MIDHSDLQHLVFKDFRFKNLRYFLNVPLQFSMAKYNYGGELLRQNDSRTNSGQGFLHSEHSEPTTTAFI